MSWAAPNIHRSATTVEEMLEDFTVSWGWFTLVLTKTVCLSRWKWEVKETCFVRGVLTWLRWSQKKQLSGAELLHCKKWHDAIMNNDFSWFYKLQNVHTCFPVYSQVHLGLSLLYAIIWKSRAIWWVLVCHHTSCDVICSHLLYHSVWSAQTLLHSH